MILIHCNKNFLLQGLSDEEKKLLKTHMRRMKNRTYAAESRDGKEREIERLKVEKDELQVTRNKQ